MKFVALVSGGKDSCFNILHCIANGHELAALANLYPADKNEQELDSFMFQTVGHDVLDYYSECCEVPMYRQPITGKSKNQKLEYSTTIDDEIEDLYLLLARVKETHPDIEAVSVGAILSSYQRTRVEHVCQRLGLVSLAYLWQRDQLELMTEMCNSGLDARIIKVAAIGLNERHLTKSIQEMLPIMIKLNSLYDVHICGEGGEFETLVLDAPFFKKKKLQIVETQIVHDSSDVCYLKLKVQLIPKEDEVVENWEEYVKAPPILSSDFQEIYEELEEFEVKEEQLSYVQYQSFTKIQVKKLQNKLFISNIISSQNTLEDQTIDVFTQLSQILDNEGLTFQNIQASQLLVSSMANFARINGIYQQYFPYPLPPSRICVETILPQNVQLQLSVTVLLNLQDKKGIHIQGRSYWAPSNIGPYSQSIIDTSLLATVSGQIPLIPASMELCTNARLSTVMALQHFHVVKELIKVPDNLSVVAFITSDSLLNAVLKTWELYDGSNPKQLVVVKVTNLPRNASVEWGGLSYKQLDEVDSDEDEVKQDLSDFDPSLRKINGEIFDTSFYNVSEFANALSENQNIHYVCYGNPEVLSDNLKSLMQTASLEFVPTLNVWNAKGEKYDLAVISRTR